MKSDNERLIVVGSGLAGLSCALTAARLGSKVLLVTAGPPLSGSSWYAQGGIAAAVGEDDSPTIHEGDTLRVGVGLNDRSAVEVLVGDGRRDVLDLVRRGVPFDGPAGHPDLGLEAGHSRRRILHAGGGATGEVMSAYLIEIMLHDPGVEFVGDTPVDRLLTEGGRVVGVGSGEREYRGKGVVLATGGYAGLWGRSTNPAGNRGVGLALAWSVGATLADLEFVQFHPTALNLPGAPAYLLSEALRGEGALLVDGDGNKVVEPLLPRDVVARAIARHMAERGPVYLTLRHLDPEVKEKFGTIARQLRAYGLDLARDLIPVAPAAHYCMGGIRTDIDGRTGVSGLYAAGEVACTGAQGANRLASNSLLECLVYGERAAHAAATDLPAAHAEWRSRALPDEVLATLPAGRPSEGIETRESPEHPDCEFSDRLDRDLGVSRNGETLAALAADLPDPNCPTPNDHTVAALAARAALVRQESRGAHYRTDYTETRPEWRGRILWRRGALPTFEEVVG